MSTYQKAAATLRAAGFDGAKFHRSGMVRGWGTWSSGFKVRRGDGATVAEVNHQFHSDSRGSEDREQAMLAKYAEALTAAGFIVARDARGDTLELRWPAPPSQSREG